MREDLDAVVVDFRRRLTSRQVVVGPSRSIIAVRALRVLSERSREQVYWALRASMLSRAEDIRTFDSEFALFWDNAEPLVSENLPTEQQSSAGPRNDLPASELEGQAGADAYDAAEFATGGEGADDDGQAAVAASPDERLAQLDFSEYSTDDLPRARALMWQLARQLPRRRARRLEPSNAAGQRLDVRRTLRTAIRTDTELMHRDWLTRKKVNRRLVLLVDISGSMEAYALPLLMFCQAAIRHARSVEAFTFGTRLTSVTPHLRRGSAQAALECATRVVPDWAGGTRIGESLQAFNQGWGRRGMAAGAIVVIASDGWERGDPSLLARELGRLHRASHALLWINPVAGDPDYRPLVRGIAAALPHVDGFQAGNNLRSLEELVARVRKID